MLYVDIQQTGNENGKVNDPKQGHPATRTCWTQAYVQCLVSMIYNRISMIYHHISISITYNW